MTPLPGIACFYDVGFGARAVSRKTPIYFIYFWKAGDTRMSKINFAGTTGHTGTSGTRYIRYQRYLKSVARSFLLLTIGVVYF